MIWLILAGFILAGVLLCSPPMIRSLSKAVSYQEPLTTPSGRRLATFALPVEVQLRLHVGAEGTGRLVRFRVTSARECIFGLRHIFISSDLGLGAGLRLNGQVEIEQGNAHVTVFTSRLAVVGLACAFVLAFGTFSWFAAEPTVSNTLPMLFLLCYGCYWFRNLRTATRVVAHDAARAMEGLTTADSSIWI